MSNPKTGQQLNPLIVKINEMNETYGELAPKVAQEVLNNIPLTYQKQREIWMKISNHYKEKSDAKGSK